MIIKSFKIEEELYKKVCKLAKKQDRTFSYIVRKALQEYLKGE